MTFATLIKTGNSLTLRINQDGAIKAEYPITARNAALLVVEGALFIRDQFQSLPSHQTNQTQQEQ